MAFIPFGKSFPRLAHSKRTCAQRALQQFYAYGVVGVTILFALYWNVYREIRKISEGPETLFLAMLLFVLLAG